MPKIPPETVIVSGLGLSIDQLVAVSREGALVRLTADAEVVRRIDRSRDFVNSLATEGRPLYGVTTCFGGMATKLLTPEQAIELQNNAVWLHKTGVGRRLERNEVRAGMLLRINALAHGVSGIRIELIRRLEAFLNHSVTPVVYEFGSIGASGDLVPLSYVAGALIGSEAGFQVEFRDHVVDAREALGEIGFAPLSLEPKEGLALINGTSISTGIAAGCLWDARRLVSATLGAHALMIEALGASRQPFDPFVHAQKPHPGQMWTADRMRTLLQESRILNSPCIGVFGNPSSELIQDRYSVRCLPQFVGPLVEGIREATRQIEVEMNSASDNPLIDADAGCCYYGGNFLGQVPALAMDHLRQYLGLLAKHLDAQIALLMEPRFSAGLPASLVGNPKRAVNMGLKGLQLTGNSIMPLLTFLGNTFIDRFPTHAEQFNQNINSQSYLAAQLARESVRVYQHYLSIALLIAVQAVDLRTYIRSGSYDARPLLAPATRSLYETIRDLIGSPPNVERPYVWNDNEQQLDLHAAAVVTDLTSGGRIHEALGQEMEP